MSIVWPCSLSVDAYVAGGRDLEFPRPDCPSCSCPMTFWSGYRRPVREAGLCHKIFVPRLRCRGCAVTHALLPCFVLAGRLDVAETIGTVLEEVLDGPGGMPTDPRLVPVLVSMVSDDNWFQRTTATTMLGFVPCEASVSLPVLHRVLAEDEALDVRIAARHAIHTVECRYQLVN